MDDQHPAPEARRGLGEIGPSPLRGDGVRELATGARALHAAPSAWARGARSITLRRASGTLRPMHAERDVDRVPEAVPPAVLSLVRTLADAGHEAVLVGGGVRDLLRGVAVSDFDVATAAPPELVLALFPRAVPIGLAHGTVMVPTRAGPVDVTSYRAGPNLRDDLAHRDFTLNALAWSPEQATLIDPFDGRARPRAGAAARGGLGARAPRGGSRCGCCAPRGWWRSSASAPTPSSSRRWRTRARRWRASRASACAASSRCSCSRPTPARASRCCAARRSSPCSRPAPPPTRPRSCRPCRSISSCAWRAGCAARA